MNAHGVAVERRHESPILSSFHAAFSCGALIGAGTSALAAGADLDVRWHLLTVAVAFALAVGLVACRALLPADADHAGGEAAGRCSTPPRALWAVGAVGFCALVCEGRPRTGAPSTSRSRSTRRPASPRSRSRPSRRR